MSPAYVNAFFDTSALMKRYVEEPGSNAVVALLDRADSLTVSVLCLPESISAFRRLVREGRLSPDEYRLVKGRLLRDLANAEICHLVPQVVDLGVACLERHALRTLDALQLACSLAVHPDVFVSADRRQVEAARREGLVVAHV